MKKDKKLIEFIGSKSDKAAALHDLVLKHIMGLDVEIVDLPKEKFLKWPEGDFHHYKPLENKLIIERCTEPICYIREGTIDHNIQTTLPTDELVGHLFPDNQFWADAYGSIIINNELLLNDYDGAGTEHTTSPDGFVNICLVTTITVSGVVRFSQVVYSLRFKRFIIRDNVCYKLPFKVNLKDDFGGKRAVYRYGRILSIRTNEKVYKKVDKKYHQSIKQKGTLSYPRLHIF